MKTARPYDKRNGTRAIGLRVDGRTPDGRGSGARKAKHLIAKYTAALGGPDRLNLGELEQIKRLANLTVLCERQEALLAADDPRYSADHHLRAVGNIRRIVEAMDLPKQRHTPRPNFDPNNPHSDDDTPGESLEEWLARGAPESGSQRKRRARLS